MPNTVSVLCRAYDQKGLPVNGAVFYARLSVTEIYDGFVVPEAVEATVGSDGTCVLNLWPNVLGTTGSHYEVGGWNPDTGRWFLKGMATIPNSDCNLEDVISLESLDSIDTSTLKSVRETSALVLASRDTAQAAALSASVTLSQVISSSSVLLAEMEADKAATASDRNSALASKLEAEEAQEAAEAARDAAIIGSGLYATEAEGRAAVADGAAFKVQGSGDVAAFEYRRVNSTTSTLLASYPSIAAVNSVFSTLDPIAAEFDIVPPKNLYNPALALDGFVYNFVGGAQAAFANSAISGRIPVVPGNTYTLSQQGNSRGMLGNVYCWDGNGVYLGMAALQTTNPVIAGMNLVRKQPTASGGYREVTFTVPALSGIATIATLIYYGYGAHTTQEFTDAANNTQMELGSVATEFEAYRTYSKAFLKEQPLTVTSSQKKLVVEVQGRDVYVQSEWSATHNLVQRMSLESGSNNTTNFTGTRLVAKATSLPSTSFVSGSVLASQGDDACPMNYNSTYIGANHGANVVRSVPAAAHGKTAVDIGSRWTDALPRQWTLVGIPDANTLLFVSANLSVYPAWSFAGAFTGATLTHVSGATNTASVGVSSSTTTQMWPAHNNRVVQVLLDGITPATSTGLYYADSLVIDEQYQIVNPAAAVSYLQANVGSATAPALNHDSIAGDVKRSITYLFAENGSCTITDGVQILNNLTIGYLGATQAAALNYTGKQLWQYIPRVLSKSNASGTWNFQAQANISGAFEQISLVTADWADANNPPDRMAQIVKTGGVPEFGFMVGYSPRRSVGVPALRRTLVNASGFVSAARKQYPYAVNVPALVAGTAYDIVAFRAWWNAADTGDASAFTWYRDGKSVIVVADFHQSVSNTRLKLPSQFFGMDVSVVDKSNSLTLHGNGVLNSGGLQISVSGGYGYGVFKLD